MARKPQFIVPAPVAEPTGAEILAAVAAPAKVLGGLTRQIIDALPGVQYAEGEFEPGTHELPTKTVEVPTLTGPALEKLGEIRANLRSALEHGRTNALKTGNDSRAVAAETALRKFDQSGDGIRLRLFCINGLKESSHAAQG